MKKLLVLGLMLALVALLCPGCGGGGSTNGGTGSDISSNPITAGGGNRITGNISDNKAALAGITVQILQPPANGGTELEPSKQTDAGGNFAFDNGYTNGWANIRITKTGDPAYPLAFNNIIRVNGNNPNYLKFFSQAEVNAMLNGESFDASKTIILFQVGDSSYNPCPGITANLSPASFRTMGQLLGDTVRWGSSTTDGSTIGIMFLDCDPGQSYTINYSGLVAAFDPANPLMGISNLSPGEIYLMPYVTCYR